MINMGSGLFGEDNNSGVLSKMKKSAELCSGENAYAFIQAATLAHMDAHVCNNPSALSFLNNSLLKVLQEKNIPVSEIQ
jgi:hypothetical protein